MKGANGDVGANPISLSVAPCVKVVGGSGYRLQDSLRFMEWALAEPRVDAFEFRNLAEWDPRTAPLDEGEKRLAAWTRAAKRSIEELSALLTAAGLPILSVHANRDVGVNLCSGDGAQVERGRTLIRESLALAKAVGAPICVFHLWDTWRESFDVRVLEDALRESAAAFPDVTASVENVPTHLDGQTPFSLVDRFEWITLDLRWATLYDELERFRACIDRLANVHVRLDVRADGQQIPDDSPAVLETVGRLVHDWGYAGPLTLEPLTVDPDAKEHLGHLVGELRAACRQRG